MIAFSEVTYRADDRPDLFHKNDQFVDKIRVDADGNVLERIQTKFVGSDGQSWRNWLRHCFCYDFCNGCYVTIQS